MRHNNSAILLMGSLVLAWTSSSFAQQLAQTRNAQAKRLQIVEPGSIGLNHERLQAIETLAQQGIQEGKMPGCVICVGRHGKIGYLKAFGNKRLQPTPEAMQADTVFDLASITKPVVTATSIMKLVESGRVRLGSKVVDFFPEFAPHGKEAITVQDLLIHQSGLIPDNALKDYQSGSDVAWQRICELALVAPVGTTFKYSDVNFIVLAEIVKKVTGQNVHEFSQQEIFKPLGMLETGYLPDENLRHRAAPTEQRGEEWIQGEVHDPRAFALNGVAGHAGLFSTAEDLAIYAHMMLGRGTFIHEQSESTQVLAPATFATMTRGYPVSSGVRGLGWDKRTGYSSNRGDMLSDAAFGHGGFTGTVLWIDPELDLFFIFLSNRVHPNGKGSVNHLAGAIANVVASATDDVEHQAAIAAAPVLCGIDVLQRDGYRQLVDQRIGLITNHTGRNRSGVSDVELFRTAAGVNLVGLFSPEHGFEGKLDVSKIEDSADKKTGLKIFSLYGETRKPTPEMLAEIDTLVFDIQDVGARFYTYISTMGEAMRAAAELKKRFVVLDRPNPINGIDVAGPMLDAGSESFVGFHNLPVRHGMTTGELARMLASELKLELDLEVIRCEGWSRNQFWDATNLMWVNPSPNMRSLTQALLYPGVGLLETTNVSVGRGTDTPFEILGAPWIHATKFAAALNAQQLAGVAFVPIEFTPNSSKFANESCGGVNLVITDRSSFEPLRVGFELACQLRALYPNDWEIKNYNRLLGNRVVFEAIESGEAAETVLHHASEGLSDFKRRRSSFLLY
jgi:uncharacterized protein YbbC (DUF1343 family)/CubicO group peptidase (beta-lactamase class C family)